MPYMPRCSPRTASTTLPTVYIWTSLEVSRDILIWTTLLDRATWIVLSPSRYHHSTTKTRRHTFQRIRCSRIIAEITRTQYTPERVFNNFHWAFLSKLFAGCIVWENPWISDFGLDRRSSRSSIKLVSFQCAQRSENPLWIISRLLEEGEV